MKSILALGCALCLAVHLHAENVLILPFSNASKTPNLDWIGESVSETMREALVAHGMMALTRDDRQEAYRRLGIRLDAHFTRATAVKIGLSLDAEQVVWGEFELVPPPQGTSNTRGSLRMTAHILDLKKMKQGPEFAEVGALEDLAARQAHLAWQTLQFLAPKSAPSETEFQRSWPPVRVDAIESYIRGLLAATPEQKYRLFTQAIRLEPGYSDAAYQLGLLSYSKKDYRVASDWLQKVSPSDIHFRPASFYLGICRFHIGDYAGAQSSFERVVAAVPLNEVYNNLGAAQSRRNLPDSLDSFKKAVEGDSTDPVYHFNLGYALWKRGRFAEAAESFRAVLDRDPKDQEATSMLGRCLKAVAPKPTELKEGLERLKTNYEESAYVQLKALLQAEKP